MSITCVRKAFVQHLAQERHLSTHTLRAYQTDLEQCASFLRTTRSIDLQSASHKDLRDWVVALSELGLNSRSINRKLASLKAFFSFLVFKNHTAQNPASSLRSLRTVRSHPVFLKEKKLLHLLWEHPFENNFVGWRAKLVLELLYGTGLRLSELLHIRSTDINENACTLKVLGKRQKQRIVPLPTPILNTLASYKIFRDKTVVDGIDNDAASLPLILTASGKAAYPMLIYRIVREHLRMVTDSAQCSPHVLRHTFATHLLLKGADLKAIQDLLGHASLSATQIYTHHTLKKLKETFAQAHPRS